MFLAPMPGLMFGASDVIFTADANVGAAKGGATANMTLQFNSNGTIAYTYDVSQDAPPDPNVRWFADGSGGSVRWIRMTVNSGTVTTGTTGSWLALSSNQSWIQTRTTIGTQTASVTIQIATDAGGANIVNTWTFTFYATRTS